MSDSMVYIVSAGEYSDYRIIGVYSSRARAEAVVEEQRRRYALGDGKIQYGEDPDIEEWKLDDPAAQPPGAFVVTIDERGAVVYTTWRDGRDPHTPPLRNANELGGNRFVGYGEDRETARRSAEQLRRSVLGGTIVE